MHNSPGNRSRGTLTILLSNNTSVTSVLGLGVRPSYYNHSRISRVFVRYIGRRDVILAFHYEKNRWFLLMLHDCYDRFASVMWLTELTDYIHNKSINHRDKNNCDKYISDNNLHFSTESSLTIVIYMFVKFFTNRNRIRARKWSLEYLQM